MLIFNKRRNSCNLLKTYKYLYAVSSSMFLVMCEIKIIGRSVSYQPDHIDMSGDVLWILLSFQGSGQRRRPLE